MRKNKLFAVSTALLTSLLLTACDSGSQPVVEEQTEVETEVEAEPTEEATEEPGVTEEATEAPAEDAEATEEAAQEEDVIIRINCFNYDFEHSDPFDLLLYENVAYMYMLEDANVEAGGTELYRVADLDTTNLTIHGYPDATEVHSVDGVFFTNVDSYTGVYFLVDGEYLSMPSFIPFFYNETKGGIVGLDISTEYAEPRDALFELRYLSDFDQLSLIPVEDSSIYEF
jgi:hypothetical protein